MRHSTNRHFFSPSHYRKRREDHHRAHITIYEGGGETGDEKTGKGRREKYDEEWQVRGKKERGRRGEEGEMANKAEAGEEERERER